MAAPPSCSCLEPVPESCRSNLGEDIYYCIGQDAKTSHLTVGRTGYGWVRWEGDCEVEDGLLKAATTGRVVRFGRCWMEVYPNDLEHEWPTPPRGQGLNKPATIALHNCHPDDPECTPLAFVARLRGIPDTRFLDYCFACGTWTFAVDHFTRYGLIAPADPAILEDVDGEDEDGGDHDDFEEEGHEEGGHVYDEGEEGHEDAAEEEEEEETAASREQYRGRNINPAHTASLTRLRRRAQPFRPPRGLPHYIGQDEDYHDSPEEAYLEDEWMTSDHTTDAADDDLSDERVDEDEMWSDESRMDSPLSRPESGSFVRHVDQFATTPHGFYSQHRSAAQNPSLPQQLGLEPRRIQQMKTSLFFEQSAEQTQIPKPMPSANLRTQTLPTGAIASPVAMPSALLKPSNLNQLPLGKGSMFVGKEERAIDAGLFLGRSFRVGWAPGGVIYHSGKVSHIRVQQSQQTDSHVGQPKGEYLHIGIVQREQVILSLRPQDEYINLLENHYANNAGSREAMLQDTNEQWGIDPEKVCDLIASNDSHAGKKYHQVEDDAESQLMRHNHNVWSLAKALWGTRENLEFYLKSTDDSEEIMSKRREQDRRAALSLWLESTIKQYEESRQHAEAQAEGEATYLHRMLILLSTHSWSDAVKLALERKDFYLASLIPLAGRSSVRQDLSAQLDLWHEKGHEDYIHKLRLTIYALLAGRLNSLQHGTSGWEWRRWFAASLWYGGDASEGIASALVRYDHLVATQNAPRPEPAYLAYQARQKERSSAKKRKDLALTMSSSLATARSSARDAIYELLATYARKSSGSGALNPLAHTALSTDYHLPWHLLSVLQALGLSPTGRTHHYHLHYAAQLEAAGLWHWAVYVMLHSGAPETAILDLVARHIVPPNQDGTHFRFLTARLGIPERLLYQVLAWRAGYVDKDKGMQALYLRKAELWQELHELVITYFAPSKVLQNDAESLRTLLEELRRHARAIGGWESGGEIYLEYLGLCQHWDDRHHESVARASELSRKISSVSSKPHLTRGQQVCLAHMARDMLLRLAASPQPDGKQTLYRGLIARQPLPPDSRLAMLSSLSAHFLVSSSSVSASS